jgi:16S rRNA (cytosine1402-N4)-methyltransferase
MAHVSVLLQETIDALNLRERSSVCDATFGGGGHSMAIAERIGTEGTLYAIDQDADAFTEQVIAGLKTKCQLHFAVGNFRHIGEILDRMGAGKLDAVVFDLGLSSMQLDDSGRGFSFRFDEPLRMTFARDEGEGTITAEEVVNEWQETTLKEILRGFGEEPFSGRIARMIVKERAKARIVRTKDLVAIVERAVPAWYRRRKIHPATRTFQAIRMAVNDELGAIEKGIPEAFARLKDGGRIAVITFHSVEDRAVKRLFKELAETRGAIIVTKRPISPSREEIRKNPRSRSAKLRVIQRQTTTTP